MWNQAKKAVKSAHNRIERRTTFRRFRREFEEFRRLASVMPTAMPISWDDRYPCLDDRTTTTGFDRHYVYHTAWAARVLAETRPVEHVDIGSSLYFVGIVSAFLPVKFFDYRPADLRLAGLTTGHADLTRLPFQDASIPSLSCLHVLEHIGLGRYGDPLDPQGDLHAMSELQRVLANGGSLLVAMPVGRPRIAFNAHRVYSVDMIRQAFAELTLQQFALVPDDPSEPLLIDPSQNLVQKQSYGCGCFWFRKAVRHG